MHEKQSADVLIVGAGLGGIAAALASTRLGRDVVLTEETDRIGGQATAQAVPPDEHPWIEQTGCTRSYRRFRDGVRRYYRDHYPLRAGARTDPYLNPGRGWVSGICHEPRVALEVLRTMLEQRDGTGRLRVLLRHRPVAVETEGDRVTGVAFEDLDRGEEVVFGATFVLDATELGDLLALGGVEHVAGSEGRAQTGEPHALDGPSDPLDQQAVTWCFALEHFPGEDHSIPEPDGYPFWRDHRPDFWPGPQLGWRTVDPETLETLERPLFAAATNARDLWSFRRILYREQFTEGAFPSDVTLVNWPQIDYWLRPLVGTSPGEKAQALGEARALSLSMLRWMQTEAPRPDGGEGYPGLRLCGSALGTDDGLARNVYVRESRRIRAEFTVLEQHVGVEARPGRRGAEPFRDSVGVGAYRIDLHPSTGGRNYIDVDDWPFQIPLGAFIPVRVENLLPASKNIGTTHVTNGCYRLHPVEWNVGEAAGALAAYCLENDIPPRGVRADARHLRELQRLLTGTLGIQIQWPREIAETPMLSEAARST
ncbi:MAG: FAD-dependent oxidoreductase [Actinomycetota bacterium]